MNETSIELDEVKIKIEWTKDGEQSIVIIPFGFQGSSSDYHQVAGRSAPRLAG